MRKENNALKNLTELFVDLRMKADGYLFFTEISEDELAELKSSYNIFIATARTSDVSQWRVEAMINIINDRMASLENINDPAKNSSQKKEPANITPGVIVYELMGDADQAKFEYSPDDSGKSDLKNKLAKLKADVNELAGDPAFKALPIEARKEMMGEMNGQLQALKGLDLQPTMSIKSAQQNPEGRTIKQDRRSPRPDLNPSTKRQAGPAWIHPKRQSDSDTLQNPDNQASAQAKNQPPNKVVLVEIQRIVSDYLKESKTIIPFKSLDKDAKLKVEMAYILKKLDRGWYQDPTAAMKDVLATLATEVGPHTKESSPITNTVKSLLQNKLLESHMTKALESGTGGRGVQGWGDEVKFTNAISSSNSHVYSAFKENMPEVFQPKAANLVSSK